MAMAAWGGMSTATRSKPLEGGEIEHDLPIGPPFGEGIRETLARLHPDQALTGNEGAGLAGALRSVSGGWTRIAPLPVEVQRPAGTGECEGGAYQLTR
jgi:hypothetical protein